MELIRERLRARYGEPHRRYHDLRHLAEVLTAVDQLAEEADDVEVVRWAAWFHDAIYEVGASDNEERSARLAESELAGQPMAAEVARLVQLTKTHKPVQGDANGAVLCDADLRILAADSSRYAEYAADVREEYAAVGDADFVHGRIAVLQTLVEGPIYHTEAGRRMWEEAARSNVRAEIERLRAS
jgi:predicted metal-dependent HD superfamily phosphohydrolase